MATNYKYIRASFTIELAQLTSPTTYANVKQAEVQYSKVFVHRVVPGFSRGIDENFWHRLIFQLSHSDPVIWDAVNALACLIRHPQYSHAFVLPRSKKPPVTNPELRKALELYSNSITGLRPRMSIATIRPGIAAITCILYICIECMQENMVGTVALYQQAVAMLGLTAKHECGNGLGTQHDDSLENTIRALLRHTSVSHGLPVQPPELTNPSKTSIASFSAAREELYVLIGEAHQFIWHVSNVKSTQHKDWQPSKDLILRRNRLETNFLDWHAAVKDVARTPSSVGAPDYNESHSVSLVAYAHYFIWLSTCLSNYETAFDDFFPAFQCMTEHDIGATYAQHEELRSVFTFETRFIPSLFFVVIKCRHPRIRRQAIRLLRDGPKMENYWKAEVMTKVAERNVVIEESGGE